MPRAAIFNDTSPTLHYGCNAVMATLLGGLEERGIAVASLWPVGVDWEGHAATLARRRPGLVIVNGEGSIHHSAERPRARQLCRLSRFAEGLGAPSFLVNASLSTLDTAAIDDLRRFTRIYVREGASREYLADHGIAAEVVPDLSLGAERPEGQARAGLLVTDSVIPEVSASLRDFAARTSSTYESMKARPSSLFRWRRSLQKRTPLWLSGSRFRVSADYPGFLGRLGRSTAALTGRFHTVMFCFLTETPFLSIRSNTAKIEATLTDALGGTGRMIEPADLAAPDFAARAGLAAFDAGERARLTRYLSGAANARASMFDAIAARAA